MKKQEINDLAKKVLEDIVAIRNLKATNKITKTALVNLECSNEELTSIYTSQLKITEENYKILQLLDLLKDIDLLAEVTGDLRNEKLFSYMKKATLTFSDLDSYLDYYPEKIYKNLYKVGLLNGVFTS